MLGGSASILVAMLGVFAKAPPGSNHPGWEVIASGHVQVGVGLHVHEPPITTGAFDFDLGPEFAYEDLFILRPAISYGFDVTGARPVEQFATAGLGIGFRIPFASSLEYLPAVQLGAYQREFEPAFRHSLTWHLFYYVGIGVQHIVAGRDPLLDANMDKPRQIVRIMFSVDAVRLIAYAL